MIVNIIENFFGCCHKHHHKPRAVKGRFGGLSIVTPKGEIPLSQQVPPSTALTGPLLFTDQFGNPVKGPIGTLSSSVPLDTLSLSADGQSFNFTSPATGDVTILWHDPAGNVPDFTGDFSDQPVLVITGAFGAAVPGVTP